MKIMTLPFGGREWREREKKAGKQNDLFFIYLLFHIILVHTHGIRFFNEIPFEFTLYLEKLWILYCGHSIYILSSGINVFHQYLNFLCNHFRFNIEFICKCNSQKCTNKKREGERETHQRTFIYLLHGSLLHKTNCDCECGIVKSSDLETVI